MRTMAQVEGVGVFPVAVRLGMPDWRFAAPKSGVNQDRILYAGPTVSAVERQIVADGWDPSDYRIFVSMPSMIAFDARISK